MKNALLSQRYESVSGLYYNYFRDYEPATGRYTQSDPIGLAGGGLSTYGYAEGNPLVMVDFFGMETCLLTTVNSWGIRDHVAVFTSKGDGSGGPIIYDPAGSFGAEYGEGGGYVEFVEGKNASIENFKKHYGENTVEVTCKNTSREEEEGIIDKASDQPTAAPFFCSISASWALEGSSSFSRVKGGTFFPGNLKRQVERSR